MNKEVIKNVKKTDFESPNVIVGKNKSGLFVQPTYKIGDVYIDPDQIKRNYEKEKIKKRIHEEPFSTLGAHTQLVGSAYDYKELAQGSLNPQRFRNQEGQVVLGLKNIKTGPVHTYFSKIEYKDDDFSRKEMFRKTEYSKNQKKSQERGLFKNKITVEKQTFSANKEIFGPGEPDQIEVMKQQYLREQFLINFKKIKARQKKKDDKEDTQNLKHIDMFTYKVPEYIKGGFDTRIFDRLDKLKDRFGTSKQQPPGKKTISPYNK